MFQWQVVAFGKITNTGFMRGKAFAPNAMRAAELSREPTAIAFPSLEHSFFADVQESFSWIKHPTDCNERSL